MVIKHKDYNRQGQSNNNILIYNKFETILQTSWGNLIMNKTLKTSFRLFDVLPPFVRCRRDNSRKKNF